MAIEAVGEMGRCTRQNQSWIRSRLDRAFRRKLGRNTLTIDCTLQGGRENKSYAMYTDAEISQVGSAHRSLIKVFRWFRTSLSVYIPILYIPITVPALTYRGTHYCSNHIPLTNYEEKINAYPTNNLRHIWVTHLRLVGDGVVLGGEIWHGFSEAESEGERAMEQWVGAMGWILGTNDGCGGQGVAYSKTE